MTSLLETLVSPSSGGTKSCNGVTTSSLQGWQSVGLKKTSIGTVKVVQYLKAADTAECCVRLKKAQKSSK